MKRNLPLLILFLFSISSYSQDKAFGYVRNKDLSAFGINSPNKYLNSSDKDTLDNYFFRLYNFFYSGITPEDYNWNVPSEMPMLLETEVLSSDYKAKGNSFKYVVQKEGNSAIIIVYLGDIYFLHTDVRIFHPVIGPMQFKFDSNGFKLFENQKPVSVEYASGSYLIKERSKNQIAGDQEFPTYKVQTPLAGYVLKYYYKTNITKIDQERLKVKGYDYIDEDALYDSNRSVIAKKLWYVENTNQNVYTQSQIKEGYEKGVGYFMESEKVKIRHYTYSVFTRDGYPIIPFGIFDFLKETKHRYFISRKNSKYGLINVNENNLLSYEFIVYENVYDDLKALKDKYLVAKYQNQYGVIDYDGKIILPFSNNDLFQIGETNLLKSINDR